MSLFSLIATLAVIGVMLYLFNTLLPMDGRIKRAINILVLLFVFIWILQSLGIVGPIGTIRVS